jgi:phosphomannomutase/phosphoglucomutase
MNRDIFREYDIRGVADRDLTPDVIVNLGRAIGTYMGRLGCHVATLGRDVRLSSSRLRDSLVQGLLQTGIDLIDLGECPTPLLYYSLHKLETDGGVMITGSHNPADYNGFKVAVGKATIFGKEIQKLRNLIEKEDFEEGSGKLTERSLHGQYLEELAESIGRLSRPVRVAVDSGNGTASLMLPQAYEAIGCEVHPLYCEVNGHFPNHHPDPTVEANLKDLIQTVAETKSDLGIAFDGDSDRIGVVDEKGRVVWGDELMILYARQILKEHPNATFVAEVKCSKKLFTEIEKLGGHAVMWKAGHSLIKAKMKEIGAMMAAEMSGHVFFADRYYGFDDAVYAGARLLEICSNSRETLSEMLSDLPATFSTPEIRVDCPEEIKFEVVRRAQKFFSNRYKTVTIDGVRVLFEDGWGLVRASNTQPVIVLRFEADTKGRLAKIRSLVEDRLSEITRQVSSGA